MCNFVSVDVSMILLMKTKQAAAADNNTLTAAAAAAAAVELGREMVNTMSTMGVHYHIVVRMRGVSQSFILMAERSLAKVGA